MTAHAAERPSVPGPREALRFLRRDIAAMPRPLKAWLALLLLLCAVGAVGAVLTLPPGWEVLGTSPSFEWGILITGYVFFAITTSGLCLASSLGTVFGIEMFLPLEKRHAVLALLTLVTAFGLIALDLQYPISMVLGAVLSPSPFSPMWWMGVFYGAYLVFLVIEVWSIFAGRWQIHQYACVCSSVMAVLAPTTLGAVFAVLAARPYWHGAFTPPAMVTMAILSGTALLGIVFYCVVRFRLAGHERGLSLALPAIRLLMTIGIVVSGLVVVWQILWGMYGVVPGLSDANRAIFAGPLAIPFWTIRVFLGLVVPLVLLVVPRWRTPEGLFATCCLVFVGIAADRAIFVHAGQIYPGTAVGGVVSDPWVEYVPSAVEIAVILGAFGFFGLAYTLVERYLPMGEHLGHLTGGFLAGAREAPEMVEAGVAWVDSDEEVAVIEGAHEHHAAPDEHRIVLAESDLLAIEEPGDDADSAATEPDGEAAATASESGSDAAEPDGAAPEEPTAVEPPETPPDGGTPGGAA